MHTFEQIHAQPPKNVTLVPRTEPSRSRFAERTTWISDIHSPSPGDGRNVDLRDILAHTRFDHDATACSFCTSNRFHEDVALASTIEQPSSFRQDMSKFRRYAAVFSQGVWSHRKSWAARILRLRRLSTAVSASWEGRLQGAEHNEKMVSISPPVLPPLRPVSPFIVSCEEADARMV
jgi:hypothetical protein